MDILSNILYLSQIYEQEYVNSLSKEKKEVLNLKRELENVKENISQYISKIYSKSSREVQEILDNISRLIGIKNNF